MTTSDSVVWAGLIPKYIDSHTLSSVLYRTSDSVVRAGLIPKYIDSHTLGQRGVGRPDPQVHRQSHAIISVI